MKSPHDKIDRFSRRGVAALSALALLVVLVLPSAAQPAPPLQVDQDSDGTLYLVQGGTGWTLIPDPVADSDLATLTPRGELDGVIPATLLGTPGSPSAVQAVQAGDGSLYLVLASDIWTLVPDQIGASDALALGVVGEVHGAIADVGLTPPALPGTAAQPTEPTTPAAGSAVADGGVAPGSNIEGAEARAWSGALGATKVYLIDDAQAFLRPQSVTYLYAHYPVQRPVVVGSEDFDSKAGDYVTDAQKIRTTNADLVFFGGATQSNAGRLWRDLRATLGPDFKLMGANGIYNQAFLDAAGPSAEGTYIVSGNVGLQVRNGRFEQELLINMLGY